MEVLDRTERIAGVDFGDFLVWRKDGFPSYELAVVADDQAMQISEVVRERRFAHFHRQAVAAVPRTVMAAPEFYHCELVRDATGRRLAKRDADLSLQAMRNQGMTPATVVERLNLDTR